MKNCNKCNKTKELSDFHKDSKAKDGYWTICKECRLGHKPHKPILEGLKICIKCKVEKDINCFSLVNKTLRQSECKTCRNKKIQDKRNNNPLKESLNKRRQKLKAKYNITLEDYDNMYKSQQGCCKICGEFNNLLVVDHCHNINIVRGLLCGLCNTSLGGFRDNSKLLEKAILYLKDSNTDKC